MSHVVPVDDSSASVGAHSKGRAQLTVVLGQPEIFTQDQRMAKNVTNLGDNKILLLDDAPF